MNKEKENKIKNVYLCKSMAKMIAIISLGGFLFTCLGDYLSLSLCTYAIIRNGVIFGTFLLGGEAYFLPIYVINKKQLNDINKKEQENANILDLKKDLDKIIEKEINKQDKEIIVNRQIFTNINEKVKQKVLKK